MKKLFAQILMVGFLGEGVCQNLKADPQAVSIKRHLVIIDAGVDLLLGTYMVALDNPNKIAVETEFPIFLPKENIDFRAGEGLSAKEIILAETGSQIKIHKSIPAGRSLISLQFTAPARDGKAQLSFASILPKDSDSDFVIMSPVEKLVLAGEDFRLSEKQNFGHRNFQVLGLIRDCAENPCVLNVTGVPEGRRRYWIMGAIFGLILTIGGGSLGLATRGPNKDPVI